MIRREAARASTPCRSGPSSALPVLPRGPAPSLERCEPPCARAACALSSARRLVLEALFVADGPMSAEQIAGGIGGRVPPSDLASVYRNLETLERRHRAATCTSATGPGCTRSRTEAPKEYLDLRALRRLPALVPESSTSCATLMRKRFGYKASLAHFPIIGLCLSCRRDTGAQRAAPTGTGAAKRSSGS